MEYSLTKLLADGNFDKILVLILVVMEYSLTL